jgi:maleate isomerase
MSFTPNFDTGPHGRAQLGFLAVANADLIERDMFAMAPEGVGLHFTRVPMGTACTVENLAAMEGELHSALATLMPARDDTDVITFNCTSASFVIGDTKVQKIIQAARPGVKATTMVTSVVSALRAMGVSRVAMGTAYTDDINGMERTFLQGHGFDCVSAEGLGLLTDADMNRVTPQSLLEFAEYVDRPEAEAVFLSCGALRSVEIIAAAEARLGKPVICSNQASLWECLRLAGVQDRVAGFGSLLSAL